MLSSRTTRHSGRGVSARIALVAGDRDPDSVGAEVLSLGEIRISALAVVVLLNSLVSLGSVLAGWFLHSCVFFHNRRFHGAIGITGRH
jgi:hypothetical protein